MIQQMLLIVTCMLLLFIKTLLFCISLCIHQCTFLLMTKMSSWAPLKCRIRSRNY